MAHKSIYNIKKFIVFMVCLSFVSLFNNANAQNRIKIQDGVYLVTYGSTAVIEDDNNQRTISIQITQESRDQNTNEKIYKVVCGRWVRRTVKDGLRAVIAAGIQASSATAGISLTVSAAATAAQYVYDDYCSQYGYN